MNTILRGILILICFTSWIAFAQANQSNPCGVALRNLFVHQSPYHLPPIRAPQKPVLFSDPEQLVTQNGVFITGKSPSNPNDNLDLMARVLPDSSTPLGRAAQSLERKNTFLLFDDVGLSKNGSGGYSSNSRRFRLIDPEWDTWGEITTSRVIALRESMLNTRNFQRIFMHETVHNKGKALRDLGIEYDFNSVLNARVENSLYSEMSLYEKMMHHEEVKAYANNYIFASVVAHNRETLKLIKSQQDLLPASMPIAVKNKNIKIAYDSVIDHQAMLKHRKEIKSILDGHLNNIDYIKAHLSKYRRSLAGSQPGTLQIVMRKEGEGVVIQTEKMYLTLHNVKVKNGKYDLQKVYDEVDRIRATDVLVRDRVSNANELIEKCSEKGYFTAEEYLELKNRMAELSKSMRMPSVH